MEIKKKCWQDIVMESNSNADVNERNMNQLKTLLRNLKSRAKTVASYIKKHRHQRCKAHGLCKTFFITNICRFREASQKKYLAHTDFLTTSF